MAINPVPTSAPPVAQPPNIPNAPKVISPKGLYAKISKIMDEIRYLSKDKTVSFKGNGYGYLSEEKITMEIRKGLIKYGLVIFPISSHMERVGTITQVTMKYKIVDSETGEFEELSAVGQGADSQDKGAAKAMTMAFKYMQRHTFAIPSGQDPDQIMSDQLDQDPNFKPYSQQQLDFLTNVKNQLGLDAETLKKISYETCGESDFSKYTYAMADRLCGRLQAELNQRNQQGQAPVQPPMQQGVQR